uniref:Uncharacterized protein n=1 Tax=Glossina austeni TaxID=7395 RepID=A0A1A9V297_GLOAU
MVYVHNEKKWAFEILDILFTTSNEELVRIDLKTEYINRTTVGASGTLELRYEVSEDTMIEMLMYRSTSGNADSYQLLPYRIPRMKLYDYLDTYYKNGLKSCSNFPLDEFTACLRMDFTFDVINDHIKQAWEEMNLLKLLLLHLVFSTRRRRTTFGCFAEYLYIRNSRAFDERNDFE